MRLLATVEIHNLEYSSFSNKPIHPKCKSKLSIGKKRTNDLHPVLVISSNNNKNGLNYQIHQNITRTFTSRTTQGLATLRFQSPKHEVLVSKAEPIELKAFLNVLIKSSKFEPDYSNSSTTNTNSSKLSSLAPFSNSELVKAKLVILNRRDYPITSNFPFSLTTLKISNIKLTKVDVRIFKLKHLKTLDFSENCLKEIPKDGWNGLSSLLDLNLSTNLISHIPKEFCCSLVAGRLKKLNLNDNTLKQLFWMIGNFKRLETLLIQGNQLKRLPDSIGSLRNLQTLNISSNMINFLPGGFSNMRLSTLDVTKMNIAGYTMEQDVTSNNISHPFSLYQLAARCVVDKNLAYSDVDTQTQEYINIHKKCSVCTHACFESVMTKTDVIVLNSISEVVYKEGDVRIRSYACSIRCYDKLTNRKR